MTAAEAFDALRRRFTRFMWRCRTKSCGFLRTRKRNCQVRRRSRRRVGAAPGASAGAISGCPRRCDRSVAGVPGDRRAAARAVWRSRDARREAAAGRLAGRAVDATRCAGKHVGDPSSGTGGEANALSTDATTCSRRTDCFSTATNCVRRAMQTTSRRCSGGRNKKNSKPRRGGFPNRSARCPRPGTNGTSRDSASRNRAATTATKRPRCRKNTCGQAGFRDVHVAWSEQLWGMLFGRK